MSGSDFRCRLPFFSISKEAEAEAEAQVLRAFQDGVDVVIGGYITSKVAQNYNYPSELIDSGEEDLLHAAKEAKQIAHARNLEKTKTSLFPPINQYF